jgi:hypothetical protein
MESLFERWKVLYAQHSFLKKNKLHPISRMKKKKIKKLDDKSERRWKVFMKDGKSHILKMENPVRPKFLLFFFFF